MNILISDDFHINERNFSPLYSFIKMKSANVLSFVDNWKENPLNGCVGNYRSLKNDFILHKYQEEIKKNTGGFSNIDSLKNYQYYGVKLWLLVKSELSAFTIAETYANGEEFPYLSDELFQFHFHNYLEDLILTYSAACYWIDVYKEREHELVRCKAAYVFSGSYIYTKVLLEMLQKSAVKAFVIESTFMGISFYCDEQNEYLPNNYLHQYENLRNAAIKEAIESINIEDKYDSLDYLHSKSLNKFMIMNNKNVKQPHPASISRLKDISKSSVLLICQVLNDFSILESKQVINSIEHYKRIIMEVLENTDFNLIVKTHPWEKNKIHLSTSITLNEMNKFIYGLNDSFKERIYIDEDINIYHLFSNVNSVLTFCSQAGIEAAAYGKRVIVNNECSYGSAGFTSKYSAISDISSLLINNEDLRVDEYECFLNFLIAFDQMAIYNDKLSVTKLNKKLNTALNLTEYHRSLNEVSISPFYN